MPPAEGGGMEITMKDIKKDPFEEYIKNLPPTRREMGEACEW